MINQIEYSRARAVIQILKDLKSDFLLQELDCRRSPMRKSTEKTVDQIVDYFYDSVGFRHFCAVLRQGIYWNKPDFYEICLSVDRDGVEYFIWAGIAIKDFEKYIQEKA